MSNHSKETDMSSDQFLISVPPKLIGEGSGTNRPTAVKVVANNTVTLYCPIEGDPKPQITWLKNGEEINGDGRVVISNDGKNLTIYQATVADKARYKCEAWNVAGQTEKTIDLDVYGMYCISISNLKFSLVT